MHLRTWLVWIGSVVAIGLATRNPLYMAELVLIVLLVSSRIAQVKGTSIPWWWLRFGMTVIPLSALFNAATVHFGDTVLFTIPGNIALLSGIVTLEAIVYGALNGFLITIIMAVFGVFNLAVPGHQLVRSTPRAFQSMGVTVGIALSFIPQTLRRFREVRDAQAVRGHRVRRLRDWLPLWLPLLIGGLEQSTQLSEAMVARGFGATSDRSSSLRTRAALTLGLSLVLAGWLLRYIAVDAEIISVVALGGGALMVVAGLWSSGRAVPHTTYRPQRFTLGDAICLLACIAIAVLLLAPLSIISQTTLHYYPYPALSMPEFDALIGILLLGLLAPLFVIRQTDED